MQRGLILDSTGFERLVSSWGTPGSTALYSPDRYALDRRVQDLARWARVNPVEDPAPPQRRPADPRLEGRRPEETVEQAWARVRRRLAELGRLEGGDRHLAYLDRCRARRPYGR